MPVRLFAVAILACLCLAAQGKDEKPKLSEYKDKPKAPEFAGIQTWLNYEPLKMAHLKGKVVVLHLFAYS